MRRFFTACMGLAAVVAIYPLNVVGQKPSDREVTFSRDVAPILYANCAYCHRPGEVAPFSLLSYKDARPWARAIRQQVAQRRVLDVARWQVLPAG